MRCLLHSKFEAAFSAFLLNAVHRFSSRPVQSALHGLVARD
ncbi:hypothetical protein T11_12234 [Trichinella zimbabwensis]|uniref:Uncharacterized protein n=1 Tax=Trichinella zimbabwensis TaxID=268475 RepID=A0A0V1DQ58_9BILA|nr:hypothetical protein T11_12234 [Trichinella zimbabwensis]